MRIDQSLGPFGPEDHLREIAEKYDDIWRTQPIDVMPPAPIDDLKDLLPDKSAVLDLGAGPGSFSIPMAEAGFRVTAVDISSVAMGLLADTARKKSLNITTAVEDIATYLDRGTQQYEAISVLFALHYLSEIEAKRLLAAIQARTTSGGINVIHAYTKQGDAYQDNPQPERFFPENQVELSSLYTAAAWRVHRIGELVWPTPDGSQYNHILYCMFQKTVSDSVLE